MGTDLAGAVIGFAVLGLLYVPQLATISATFPGHLRYCGMAIDYNASTSLFGGTAPAANDWLIHQTGTGPAWSTPPLRSRAEAVEDRSRRRTGKRRSHRLGGDRCSLVRGTPPHVAPSTGDAVSRGDRLNAAFAGH